MISEEVLNNLAIRSCRGKRRFSLTKVEHQIDFYASKNVVMYYYHCPFCFKYHLTSSPPIEELNSKITEALVQKANNTVSFKKQKKRRR